MKKTAIAIAFAGLALAGCGTTGTNVVADQLKGVEIGKTTRADIEAKLGKPTFERKTPDGLQLLSYVWVDPDIRTASFYFINEGPTAGVDAVSRSAGFFFDEKGVLFDMLGSQREFGTGVDSKQQRTFHAGISEQQ
jgi:hypothetical protein